MKKFGIVFLVLFSIGVFFVIILITLIGFHYETGRGEHTGYITAVERTGIFFKTGTAYLKTDTQSSQEDAYCFMDKEIEKKLQEYSVKKIHVNAYFFQWLSAGIKNCSGEGAIIYKVEPLSN